MTKKAIISASIYNFNSQKLVLILTTFLLITMANIKAIINNSI